MMNKKLTITLTGLFLACASPCVLADTYDDSGVINAVNQLNGTVTSLGKSISGIEGKMVALEQAGEQQLTDAMYQYDKDLPQTMQINENQRGLNKETNQTATTNTNNKVQFELSALSDTIAATQPNAEETGAIQRNQDRNNAVSQLTVGTPASDTLYSTNPLVINQQFDDGGGPKFDVSRSNTLHDNYFNFATLINSTAYTP